MKIYRFSVYDEKILQEQIFNLILKKYNFKREYRLDSKSIIDFYEPINKIGIEIKVKGNVSDIYRQCKRYCENDLIKELILISAKTMNLPKEINGKKTSVILITSNNL